MIAFVKGSFVKKTPAQVIVDVNGIGYDLQISLNTYSAISNQKEGQLLTYLHITENAHTMYGFYEQSERELFLQLLSVSGIGASTARMMLSGMKPEEIIKAISLGNTKLLESIKGVGRKTAERIVVDLKDKLGRISLESAPIAASMHNTIEQDALNALIALGISKNAAETSLKKVYLHNSNSLTIEEVIKLALKNL